MGRSQEEAFILVTPLHPPRTRPRLRALLLLAAVLELVSSLWVWCHPPIGVLLFHDIAPAPGPRDFWTLAPAVFGEILDRVRALGFETLDDAGLLGQLEGWRPRRPSVVLTFDDGLASHAGIAAPELARRGMRGLFFVIAGPEPGAAPGTRRIPAGEARRIVAAGHRLGSHSATHGSLVRRPDETPERFRARLLPEVVLSRAAVRKLMGRSALAFAYPRGEVSPEARAMVRLAGYRLAFTTDVGHAQSSGDPLALPRNLLFRDATADTVEAYLTEPLHALGLRLALDQLLVLLLALSFGVGRRVPASSGAGDQPPR